MNLETVDFIIKIAPVMFNHAIATMIMIGDTKNAVACNALRKEYLEVFTKVMTDYRTNLIENAGGYIP